MKVRDSGMPAEEIWSAFFNIELILTELHVSSKIMDLVEIGCGYGTFTIPSSEKISGNLYGFDVEEEMLEIVKHKLTLHKIDNVTLEKRDILSQTTGLKDGSIDYVMLFNILHNDYPNDFLNEAYRILKTKGMVGILHWRSDISTPRGPELSIRPKPHQMLQWIDRLKFKIEKEPVLLGPYHFGLVISKL